MLLLVSTALAASRLVDPVLWATMAVGGGCLSLVGLLDDRIRLPASIRLAAQVGMSVAATYLLTPETDTDVSALAHWTSQVVTVLCLVWLTNAYNFMDGIDGLAGSEAVFVSVMACLLLGGSGLGLSWLTAALAGATLGFTFWNWPPAKIFMGDVGSAFLGYVFGIMIIATGGIGSAAFPVWVILLGVFIVDSVITMARRLVLRERWWEAHRSHAYQRLARRWQSHRATTSTLLAINLAWLAPMALAATRLPQWSRAIAAAALLPLALAALVLGAGLPDTASDSGSSGAAGVR